MKRYEIPFIVHTDLTEEDINNLIDRYKTIITDAKGVIVKVEKWGKRKLFYEVKKQRNGYYILFDFVGDNAIITEVERNFKIDDRILKYMTIRKEDRVDLAEIEKEIQEAAQIPVKTAEPVSDSPLMISTETTRTAGTDEDFAPTEPDSNQ